GILYLKETFSFDGKIEGIVGCLKSPLSVVALSPCDPYAQSHLDTGGRAIAVSILSPRDTNLAVEQIFEVGPVLLEAGSVDIGHVIGNHVELGLERFHASGGRVEGLNTHGDTVSWIKWVIGGLRRLAARD